MCKMQFESLENTDLTHLIRSWVGQVNRGKAPEDFLLFLSDTRGGGQGKL